MTFHKYFYPFILCCLLSIISLNGSAQCGSVSQTDSLELVKLYNALNGPNWDDTTWLVKPVKDWVGITLEEDSCTVVQITLNGASFVQGELPANLALPDLKVLNLSTDSIYGEIPNFQNLPSLITLNLASNALTGTLPDFTNLVNLENLSVAFNELTGSFPSFTNMPSLEQLIICPNEFEIGYPDLTGAPMVDIAIQDFSCLNCTSIQVTDSLELIKFYNSTGGSSWSNNTGWEAGDLLPVKQWFGVVLSQDECEIAEINLISNNLSGIFPTDLQLASLEKLSIQQNAVWGALPDMIGLPNLTLLEIYDNQFTENFPNLQLPKLREVDASFNNFFGPIPDFDNLASLQRLYLRLNQLGGPIPDFNLPKLQYLVIDHNDIYDGIPDFSNISNLEFLELSHNNLSGNIPDFSNIPNLQYLSLNNNSLCGSIPDFSNLPELGGFFVCPNEYIDGNQPSMSNTSLSLDDVNYNCIQTGTTFNCDSLLSVGVEQLPTLNWQIAPNPTTGIVHLTLDEISATSEIVLTDLTGQVLLRKKTTQNYFDLDLSHLANGMYVLSLSDGVRLEYEKIIVRR